VGKWVEVKVGGNRKYGGSKITYFHFDLCNQRIYVLTQYVKKLCKKMHSFFKSCAKTDTIHFLIICHIFLCKQKYNFAFDVPSSQVIWKVFLCLVRALS
jgi:hypothetical protein